MLNFFRQQPLRRVALWVAFAFLFMATVGEVRHFAQHEGTRFATNVTQPCAINQADAPVVDGSASCPVCEWAQTPMVGFALAAPFAHLLFYSLLFRGFAPVPLFAVRLLAALRESRGPPCLA